MGDSIFDKKRKRRNKEINRSWSLSFNDSKNQTPETEDTNEAKQNQNTSDY